jgi:anti-anti-sigma regulatory factor
MPIHKMQFQDGVFYAKQVGYVDDTDFRMWLTALRKYAKNSDQPIMAVMDISEVDRMAATAPKLLADALSSANVRGLAIAAGGLMSSQMSRVMGAIGEMNGVRVFNAVDDARRYVEGRLAQSAKSGGAWVSYRLATYHYAYSY